MIDVFEFPNNDENYLRKAQNHLANNNFEQAEEYLQKSYDINPTLQVFEELVNIYIALNDKLSLKNLWQHAYPDRQDILESNQVAFLYALSIPDIYNNNEGLLELYQLRDAYLNNSYLVSTINEQINLLQKNRSLLEMISEATTFNDYEAILKKITKENQMELLRQLKRMYEMPLDEIEPLYLTILRHPTIVNYIKSDLLHYLVRMNYSNNVELIWFNQPCSVNVSNLLTYQYSNIYQQTIQLIREYCENNNPHLCDEIVRQFTLQALSFYPFIDDIIDNPHDWLNSFLYMNGLENLPEDPLNKKLTSYMQRSNSEIEQILN